MRGVLACSCTIILCVCLIAGFSTGTTYAQVPLADQSADQKASVFRVKYVSDDSVYVDAGRNANLQEGMKLSLINPPQMAQFPREYGFEVTSTSLN